LPGGRRPWPSRAGFRGRTCGMLKRSGHDSGGRGGGARRGGGVGGGGGGFAVPLWVVGVGERGGPAPGAAPRPPRAGVASAAGRRVSSQRLAVPGLASAATVSFSAQGVASISAGSTHDLFLALGYVLAKFRLTELDAERRLGEGRLAQLGGASDLVSDEFELR